MQSPSSQLERESARPLYEQITDRLRRDLSDRNNFSEQLPTEENLMERYDVSRSTVRKAVQRLVDEGLLVRRQGKGTFLARPLPHIIHSIDRLAPFMETFKGAGTKIRTELIDFSWTSELELPAQLAAWERPLLSYQRKYESDGVAHAVVHVVLPHDIARFFGRQLVRPRVTGARAAVRAVEIALQRELPHHVVRAMRRFYADAAKNLVTRNSQGVPPSTKQ